jgi:muramoyltetrapeptide carboxypeptidase LdcA involved in peptidoglycan recycling
MGKELAIHDLVPLNLLGLFFGTYTLHNLIYAEKIHEASIGFFGSSDFTIVLLMILVVMSVMSIAYSSRYFSSKEE